MEEPILLRQGYDWLINADDSMVSLDEVVVAFHEIAVMNGSLAYWIPGMGVLITYDAQELSLQFPYEDWLAQAMGTSPL